MSPEMLYIHFINNNYGIGEFNPIKSDIFSLGITFLRLYYLLEEIEIKGMNDINNGNLEILF